MKKHILFLTLTAAVFCDALPVSAKPIQIDADALGDLLKVEKYLNERCRGGHGDDPDTLIACQHRDAISAIFQKNGMCGGPSIGWRKCMTGKNHQSLDKK